MDFPTKQNEFYHNEEQKKIYEQKVLEKNKVLRLIKKTVDNYNKPLFF